MDMTKLSAIGDQIGAISQTEITSLTQPVGSGSTASGMPTALSQKDMKTLIERRHPLYKKMKDHWEFIESTYQGGRSWFEKNIFQYVKEGESEFAARKQRAYRFNHSREVVDLINKHIFRQEISRNEEDAPSSVIEFRKKSTRNGLGINDLMRQISKQSSIFGRIGVVVDSTMVPGVQTIADAKKLGARVYAYVLRPDQLLDYSYDDNGDLNWILVQETYRDDEDPFAKPTDVKPRWRLWTKTGWMLFKERTGRAGRRELIVDSQGAHDLGMVPVILHDNIISDEEWHSPGMIDDIAYLDRAVANYLSNIDAIIQDQTFSQLVMPAQGLMPGEDNYQKVIDMGTKRMFLYDAEGGGIPMYISPDVKQAKLIVEIINKIINEIYHTVGLAGERTKEDNSVGIDNSSGVAKAYDFERVNSLLAAKADSLEATENKINQLVAAWNNDTLDKPLVSYPDNFDTRTLYDEFDVAGRLVLIEAPDEMRRAQMQNVIEKLFPMAPDALRKKMEGELKNWPPEEPDPVAIAPGQSQPKAQADNRQGQVTKETANAE